MYAGGYFTEAERPGMCRMSLVRKSGYTNTHFDITPPVVSYGCNGYVYSYEGINRSISTIEKHRDDACPVTINLRIYRFAR